MKNFIHPFRDIFTGRGVESFDKAMKRLMIYAFLASCFAGCTAETAGIDSDGDGLSDYQESIFCTDPANPDTDGDTIPDGIDEDPCIIPALELIPSIASVQADAHSVTAVISVAVRDAEGRWIDEPVQASASFGVLSAPESVGTGFWQWRLTAQTNGTAIVTVSTSDARTAQEFSVTLRLADAEPDKPTPDKPTPDTPNPDTPTPDTPTPDTPSPAYPELVEPGVNTGKYTAAGPMNGELWVMAIDGKTLEWAGDKMAPYKGAYVQVDLPDGASLNGLTDDRGFVHFKDDRLNGPVNVTVGASKSRYITWMQVNARYISAGIHRRDITPAEASSEGAVIQGTVRGFWGETGIPTFPRENVNIMNKMNIAIVQAATRNFPLSSMNTGSILLPPDGSSAAAEYFDLPPNLVLCNLSHPENSRYKLERLKPGKYIIFALAGVGGNIMTATQNPYKMTFEPIAMGMKEVEVRAGETFSADIDLTIDLRNAENTETAKIHFGQLPADPKTGEKLPNGLVLPLINSGKGYIFVDVNGKFNQPDFRNPMEIKYPKSSHQTLSSLGLASHPMAVGLAAREAQKGYDLPGISTVIMHPQADAAGLLESIYMNTTEAWPTLPEFIAPAPPASSAHDAVGGRLNPSRRIAWKAPSNADMTVLRFNYMTPPIHNVLLDADIGASQAHPLWEVYVPAPAREIILPTLSPEAPDYPVLVNYAPTGPGSAYQYSASAVELEINAYCMGTRKFNYQSDFRIDDINMNAWGVSQDSYLISAE